MAAPVDSARVATNIATAATSHNINVGSPVAGTLLIVWVRFAVAPGTVTFTGYTSRVSDASDASDDTSQVFYRWADGSEGATDVLSTANSTKLAAICWEVTGAINPASSEPAISAVAVGTTTANTCNPGSVTPGNGTADYLFLALGGQDGEIGAYTAAPTNYVNLATANSGTGGAAASNCYMGGASRQITNTSAAEDPGAFTHAAATSGWTAFTLAISSPIYAKSGIAISEGSASGADAATWGRAGAAVSGRRASGKVATISAPWSGAGVLMFDIETNNANRSDILDWSAENGFSWVALQCFDDEDVDILVFQDYIGAWRDAIRARGMTFGLWGVHHDDPTSDASRADSQIDLWGADFYIANAEAEYKTDAGGTREHAETFCTAFRSAQPTIPAALSTFGNISNDVGILGDALNASAGVMDFKAWYDDGFHVLPQAYVGASASYRPDRTVRHYHRAHFPFGRIHPTVGIYVGSGGVDGADFRTHLAQTDNVFLEPQYKADVPRGMWKFTEASGSALDTSGNGLDLTSITGTPDYDQTGPWAASPAIRLIGGEFIDRTSPVSTVTDNFTLEALVHVQAIGLNSQTIVYNGDSGANGWGVVINTDRTWQYLAGGVAFGSVSQGTIPDAFAHLVIVRRAGTWEYYLNGKLDTANAGTSAPGTPTTRFRVGAGSLQTAYSYTALYETALAPDRIAAHYDAISYLYSTCDPHTAYGFSLFLGDTTGVLGAVVEQDYIDLGLAITSDDAAYQPSSVFHVTGAATSAFVASGSAIKVPGGPIEKAGAGVTGLVGSGADAVAHAETGVGIAPCVGAGVRAKESARTGAAISEHTGSGADAMQFVEAGAGVTGFTGGGDSALEGGAKAGAGVASLTGSGADATTHSESGAGTSQAVGSGADSLQLSETGTAAAPLVASGTRALQFPRSGAAISGFTASGAGEATLTRTGTAVINFTAAGASQSGGDIVRTGTAVVQFSSSGGGTWELSRAGSSVCPHTGGGTRIAERPRIGSAVTPFTGGGARSKEASEAGVAAVPFTVAGSRVIEGARGGTAILVLGGGGGKEGASVSRSGTAIMGHGAEGAMVNFVIIGGPVARVILARKARASVRKVSPL